jgi:hypothetical protein
MYKEVEKVFVEVKKFGSRSSGNKMNVNRLNGQRGSRLNNMKPATSNFSEDISMNSSDG